VAIDAAKAAGAPCSRVAAYDLSQDKSFYVTMMGVTPERAAEFAEERCAHHRLNCGTGMDMNGAAIVAKQYRAACSCGDGAPNAGCRVGKLEGVINSCRWRWRRAVPAAIASGANIIGSCCGSTPEHTRPSARWWKNSTGLKALKPRSQCPIDIETF